MADVTGPIGTLGGSTHDCPKGTMCDDHPDRLAVVRIQGETDSFGSEMHDLCQECADEMRNAPPPVGTCDWCKSTEQVLRDKRDYEEGMSGRVYQVCQTCNDRYNKRVAEDFAADFSDDFYDYDLDYDDRDDKQDVDYNDPVYNDTIGMDEPVEAIKTSPQQDKAQALADKRNKSLSKHQARTHSWVAEHTSDKGWRTVLRPHKFVGG